MPLKAYLEGVPVGDIKFAGLYEGVHPLKGDRWRCYCSFSDGKSRKADVFDVLAHGGQPLDPREWHLHHVVEKQDFAAVDFTGQLDLMYEHALPCVLLSQEEHRAYNSILHCAESNELFREPGLPREAYARSRNAHALAKRPTEHARLRRRVDALLQLYRAAYEGDQHLVRIAENVLLRQRRYVA